MPLTPLQIKELAQKPKNAQKLKRAAAHEARLRFHGQVANSAAETGGQAQVFLEWVRSFLTASDKQTIFEKLLTFPVYTNGVVDQVFDEYNKVFDGQNAYRDYYFSTPEKKLDFIDYLNDIGEPEWWRSKGMETLKDYFNALVVVDLPAMQNTEDPRPYFYLVDVRDIKDAGTDKDGNLTYVIFKADQDEDQVTYICIDDTYYHVLKGKDISSLTLTESVPYPYSTIPAKFFWEDYRMKDNRFAKQSPISAYAGDLDKLLWWATSKDSLDIYNAFPIYWVYQNECTWSDSEGHQCQGGVVNYEDEHGRPYTTSCPACGDSKSLVGAGTVINAVLPETKDQPVPDQPVGVQGPDRDSLDFNVEELDRKESEFYEKATGKGGEPISKQAVNQDQVQANFESRKSVLQYIARNFEIINAWVIDRLGEARYGDDYLGCSISYGTDFYLMNEQEAIDDYQMSVKAGMSEFILEAKRRNIVNILIRNNPEQRERIEILKNLEPYPFMRYEQLQKAGVDKIDPEGYFLQLNFAKFISQFEREYGDITEWLSKRPFSSRIDVINQILIDYVREKNVREFGQREQKPVPGKAQ